MMQERIYLYPGLGRGEPHYLDRTGTIADLARTKIKLKEGTTCHFYCDDEDDEGNPDDLVFDGTVHFDQTRGEWFALLDWDSFKHKSDFK